MLLAAIDWNEKLPVIIPFVGYLVGVFAIAVVAHRYLKRGDFESEYYVGGRSFGAWVLAMSWVATLASGGSFLGYPSLINAYGWSMAFWVSGSVVTALIGLGVIGKRLNRLARQTGALTLVDILRERFHDNAISVAYPLVIVFVTSVYLVAQFAFGAKILVNMLGMSYGWALFLFTVSVVAYTTYGGFRAVAWTDTMQGIIMIIGIVMLVPFALHAVGGLKNASMQLRDRTDPAARVKGLPQQPDAYLYGPGPEKIPSNMKKLLEAEAADQPLHDQSNSLPVEPWLPFSMGVSYFVLRSLGALMMPTTVPRMLAFRDTTALRRAMMLLAPYIFLMYGSSLITMNCAHSLDLGLAPYESDQSVPALAQRVAPNWLAGLIIAAPFAAVMSTVDSGLLVVSSSVVRDLVQRLWYPDLSQEWTKGLSYAVTGGIGVIVFFVALSEPTFVQPLVIYYSAGSACALFWPGLATLYWRRATTVGVLAGLIGGITVFAVCHRVKPFHDVLPMHGFVYGFVASAILTYVFSKLTPAQDSEQLDRYFGRD